MLQLTHIEHYLLVYSEACGISIGTARSHLPLPYRGNTAENPLANRHHVSKVAPSWKQKFEVVDDHSDPLSHNSARRERLHFKNIRLCHPPLPPTPPVSNVRSSRKRKTHGVSHGATPPKRRILQGDFCMERQPSAHAGMAASTAERRQMILNPLDSLKGFYALHPNIPRTPAPSKSTLMRIEAGKNDPSWADILNIDSARPYSLASVLPSDRRSYLSIATMPDHYVDSIGADLSLDIPMSRDPPKMDYFCTFCADRGYHKTFRSEAGWKFHETTYHETGENWACTLCQSSFDRHVDLTDHLYIHHDEGKTFPKSESFDRSSFDMNTVRLLPRILYGCGFRGCQALLKGWDARCEHVAKHMKDRDDHAQWYYSHILHNLIRQDATRDMAEEVTSAMSTLYPGAFVGKFDLFHAFWDPHTSRTLLQKLQCCDFRPTAARVLVAAFFMQRIEYPETDTVDLPSQLCMPILSTLPGARQTFGSNFEHILKGSSENTSVVIQELLNLPAIMDLL